MEKNSLKRVVSALLACGAVLLAALVIFSSTREENCPEAAMAEDEYRFYAQLRRAEVSAYFFQEHGVELGSDQGAWERPYDGETPAKMLDQLVMEQAGYDQALRTLSQRYGTAPMPTYREMASELKEFNQQRQETLENGGVIYGPTQYGAVEYYLTLRGNAETALVGAIIDEVLENHDRELREHYETMTAEDLKRRFMARLVLYSIDPEEFAANPEAAEQAQRIVLELLEQGAEVPVETLSAQAGLPVSRRELLLDSGTLSREDSLSPILLSQAANCGVGGCFIAPLSADSGYMGIYLVVETDAENKPDFEDVKLMVAAQYANEIFDREISELK